MTSGFSLEIRDEYIRISLPDMYDVSAGNLAQLWTTVSSLSAKYGNNRFLITAEGLTCPPAIFQEDYQALLDKINNLPLTIACCFNGYVQRPSDREFKRKSLDRGLLIGIFPRLTEALEWLLDPENHPFR